MEEQASCTKIQNLLGIGPGYLSITQDDLGNKRDLSGAF